jgi:hypothetical protein
MYDLVSVLFSLFSLFEKKLKYADEITLLSVMVFPLIFFVFCTVHVISRWLMRSPCCPCVYVSP